MPNKIVVDEISTPKPVEAGFIITKWLEDTGRQEQTERYLLIQADEMEVSRVEEKETLTPNERYMLLKKEYWSAIRKFLSATKAERHKSGSTRNMEEILLNSSLQKIANQKKDEGDSYMHDLFSKFLYIAAHPSLSPFSRKDKEIAAQFELCKIAIQILLHFLSFASSVEKSNVSTNVITIRSKA